MTPLLLSLLAPLVFPPGNPVPPPHPAPVQAARPGLPFPPSFTPFGGYHLPFWGGYGYGYCVFPDPLFPPPQAVVLLPAPVVVTPLNPDRADEAAARAAATAPASLSLEFPAPAEVWLNGEKQPADARTLTSPPLRIGDAFTFRVRARWVEASTAYEAEQTSTVRAGERGKLTVYAGKPVK